MVAKISDLDAKSSLKVNGSSVFTHASPPTKATVGLSNVNNWGASTAINSTSPTTYSTASAVKTAYDKGVAALNAANAAQSTANSKITQAQGNSWWLGKTAKAADSDKLDGLNSTDFSRSTHTHAYIPTSQKGAANGVASLDSSGKLLVDQLPSVAITDTHVVASQAAMLGLVVQVGDVAIRSDLKKTFILKKHPPSTLGNWIEVQTPTDAVNSVNGMTGTVVVSKSTVGLSLVNNWSATGSVSDTSDSKYATAGAVQQTYARADSAWNLANGKMTKAQGDSYYLGKTATAAQANDLEGHYIGGGREKPNFFGGGKLRCQMLNSSSGGGINGWTDALWISSYSGSDVKTSNVLLFTKGGTPRIGFRQQNYDSTGWGTFNEIYHSGNRNISTAVNSTSTTVYASSSAVKQAYDLAASKASSSTIANMFPVGHVLLTVNATNPSSYGYPGTWTMLDSDLTLRSTKSSSEVNKYYGTNTPAVPVASHSHTASSGGTTLNKRFNTNTTGNHSHNRGSMNITGTVYGYTSRSFTSRSFSDPAGAFNVSQTGTEAASPEGQMKTDSQNGGKLNFYAADGWTGITNTTGNHLHHTDVNFGSHGHSVTVNAAGTSGAKIDVRGRHLRVYMWMRTI